jgi:DNA-directed RNA polymerase I, II, and III subunit RPABC2
MDETYDNDNLGEEVEDDLFNDDVINDDEMDNVEDDKLVDPHSKVLSYTQIIEEVNKPKKTLPFMTKYEYTRIIGVRIEQLSRGAKPNISTKGLHTIREIAEEELKQRKTPFIIKRPLPNNTFEYWKIEEFEKI